MNVLKYPVGQIAVSLIILGVIVGFLGVLPIKEIPTLLGLGLQLLCAICLIGGGTIAGVVHLTIKRDLDQNK